MATPQRSIRVPDDPWKRSLTVAKERGESQPDLLVKFLGVYVSAPEQAVAFLKRYQEESTCAQV